MIVLVLATTARLIASPMDSMNSCLEMAKSDEQAGRNVVCLELAPGQTASGDWLDQYQQAVR